MKEEIRNKIAENTKLIIFNLEDYYTEGTRIQIDVSQWLDHGIVLREKAFRAALKNHNWEQYTNAYVAIFCSTDAIIPAWAYMLVGVHASPFVKKLVIGSLIDLETLLYQETLQNIDLDPYKEKMVIVKGCAQKPVPQSAYITITNKLISVAKSVMYGEACSSVPLFKKR